MRGHWLLPALCLLRCFLCVQITDSQANDVFTLLMERYNRSYEPDTSEYFLRMINVKESIRRQAVLNSPSSDAPHNSSATYGINQFSDLSPREFRERYLTSEPENVPWFPKNKTGGHQSEAMALPAKFDWRDKNIVTAVQNQESCGACWAFSVVGAIESVYAKEGHPLEPLSVQQVIDCSYQNQGCNGGSTIRALSWLMQSQEKLVDESEYPFKAVTGVCHLFPVSQFGVLVKNFTAFDFSGLEEEMKQKLVEWGPLIVTVDAMSWQDYLGGVIQHHCSSHHANHAVLITGYDTTGEVPYWIVRNSWGTSWGNQGYVYIKMGDNVCGIADSVAAVFV
ncbi:cathepsin O [Arapaima gigas]